MNPMFTTMVDGALTFMWCRFTKSIIMAATIVQLKAGTMSALTDPRLLPTLFHPFLRGRVLAARDHIQALRGGNFHRHSSSLTFTEEALPLYSTVPESLEASSIMGKIF